jgi:hypothetical protein
MVKTPHVFNTIPLPMVGYFRCIGISGKFQLVGRLNVRLLKIKWLSRSHKALWGFADLRVEKKQTPNDAKTQREVE